jgi:hypothetical protein
MPSEKVEEDKCILVQLISAGMKFRKKEVPACYAGIYRPI